MAPDIDLTPDLRDWLKVGAVALAVAAGLSLMLMLDAGCHRDAQKDGPEYDPLAFAYANLGVTNPEATVPSMCYTKTAGISNPCWTCHTESRTPNEQADWELQEEYSFSQLALTNHWTNLFNDRTFKAAAISDDAAIAYIRSDNYTPLVNALKHFKDYPGYRPDLDFSRGFDVDGFARDGSRWRALRYKPFLGTFWPTNGSTDDVFIRLPLKFEQDAQGQASRDVARINYAILEAAICADPAVPNHLNATLTREVEPVNEAAGGLDLDANGAIGGTVSKIKGLPAHFAGAASTILLERYKFPEGTEFLHSVRYVDPDAPGMIATRMKELRYSKKVRYMDSWGLQRAYEKEANEKQEGVLPFFAGGPEVGLVNAFGWQLQGFIEDAKGRLRLQTKQEHYFCMGCHSSIGVTVDQTFSFARKLPGKAGFAYQNIAGMHDSPQAGHADPEVLTYFKRVKGGDEFRANAEILERFFPGGTLNENEVLRASKGGDKDLAWLLAPSRPRALALTKAYMALVRDQGFEFGRDTLLAPPANVHASIVNGDTELGQSGLLFRDGKLWLDWSR
jgi:hypothetical protein